MMPTVENALGKRDDERGTLGAVGAGRGCDTGGTGARDAASHARERCFPPPPQSQRAHEGFRLRERQGRQCARGGGGDARRACFFFSSRRRHTRCLSDWSSDVCSSDLKSTPRTPPRLLSILPQPWALTSSSSAPRSARPWRSCSAAVLPQTLLSICPNRLDRKSVV